MKKIQLIPFIACSSFCTTGMAADEPVDKEGETKELPTIIVEGRKTLNTIILGAKELKPLASATSDTASLLRGIPGLNIQGGGGVSGLPVIHGLADDRLRIKVDGMDLISACGNHMNPALSYIDPSNVDTAMVYAGIAPVSVGGDSIGGAIVVESSPPEFADNDEKLLTTGEIGAFYRSNGNVQGGNLSATLASENLSLRYQASTVKADNYKAGDNFKPAGYAAPGREWLDGDEVGSTMYESTNQSISLAWRQDNHLLQLTYGEQDIPYQGWVNQRMDMTGNDSEQINLHYEGQYGWGDLEARFYNEHTRHKMQFYDDKLFWYLDGEPCTPSPSCAAGMPMDTEGDNTGATLKAEIPLSAGELLRIGAEFQQYRLDDWWDPSGRGMWPDTFWNINDGERDRLALYGEWEKQWNPQWQTLFGVRGERVDMDTGDVQGYSYEKYGADSDAFNAANHEKTDHNIDLTALARFTPNDTTTLEFGYARKTRSPNLYERYTWSTGGMAMRMINWAGDGNGYVGNLDLEPEIAHTLSATFSLHDPSQEKWGLSLTPYYTYVNDYIDATRLPDQETITDDWVYLQFVNQSARLYGLDISGYFPLAENTPYGSFTATGILGYVRGKNDDTDDNLYNMMPLNATLSVVHKLNSWTNTIEVEMVDDKTEVSWERNELQTDAYSLLHLRSSYEWKRVRVDFGIENVFDTFYNHPLGGVYMGQGVTMTGTNPTKPYVPWGLAAPGMGRSVYAGINFKF
ncbi:TonB-dependent receptor plug domain-containing protein [Thiolapillus sp.]